MASPRSPQPDLPTTLLAPALQVAGLNGKTTPKWKIEYTWLEPGDCAAWLETASEDDAFRNRPINRLDLALMVHTMKTDGFVHYLPDGPFIFDEHGILTNGKLRLTAAVEANVPIGVIVFRGPPRWMYEYLGTGRPKTFKDLRFARSQMDKRDVLVAMKMVFQYEEAILGIRPRIGWKDWSRERIQPADLAHVGNLRAELEDYYGNALAVRRGCKLVATALMMFQFYQWHAWPAGRERLLEFLDSLLTGAVDKQTYGLPKNSPAISLRNFGRDEYCPPQGKAVIHLILLFRHFAAFAQREPLAKATYAYGHEILPPYHPDGDDAAIRTVFKHIPPLNRERQA
jgi:hypothetical protein